MAQFKVGDKVVRRTNGGNYTIKQVIELPQKTPRDKNVYYAYVAINYLGNSYIVYESELDLYVGK